jgi:hypothetical protein
MELVSFDGWKWRPSNSEERERRVKSEGKRDLARACATRHAPRECDCLRKQAVEDFDFNFISR